MRRDILRLEVHAGLSRAGDELNADDRVATELEEVVVHSHLVYAQVLFPQSGQGSLGLGPRGLVGILEGRPRAP